ncbi:MAG: hypothetical protein GY858_06720 [Candidatus Omnitrophica bacterium]|nr:hypothetical protein [Candidatus Omnitrophota bacterium]
MKIKIIVLILCCTSLGAHAADLKAILSFPDKFNEQAVEIEGELIGELLKSTDGFWANILSDGLGIGFFTENKTIFDKVSYWGAYQIQGDTVLASGTFYKDCLVHGETDIHLQRLEVIKPGNVEVVSVLPFKRKLAKIFGIICLTLLAIYLIKLLVIRFKHGKRT